MSAVLPDYALSGSVKHNIFSQDVPDLILLLLVFEIAPSAIATTIYYSLKLRTPIKKPRHNMDLGTK